MDNLTHGGAWVRLPAQSCNRAGVKIIRMKTPKCLPLVVVAVLVSGCSTAPQAKVAAAQGSEHVAAEPQAVKTPPIVIPDAFTRKGVTVRVEGADQRDDGTLLAIRGFAKNVTASDLKFCEITFSLRDGGGQSVDKLRVTTKSLKSGQIWHFQVAPSGEPRADIRSIEANRVVAIPLKADDADLASNKP